MSPLSDSNLPAIRHALAGRYEIETPIGRGGMGAVYLARELRLDRAVAIKVLPPDLAIDDRYRQRFLREARTVAALMHPNIVPIHAVDEAAEWVYFVMGYVAGETLTQRVARCGPLSAGDGARLLREIGEALAYAHACGVVHRDVKPDNILLDTATGRSLLSDFGIAHVSGDGRPPSVAPRGPVLGTAAFMSPEQARGEPVDARSDLYSLGVVGFYALSGRLPFDAVTETALLVLHIAEPAPPLAAAAPGVPPRLAQVVDRCLEKDPWARFVDAAALVRAVSDAMDPPPAPVAVRAFLVRGAYLAGPARLHAALTGLVLAPAAVASWLDALDPALRTAASAALGLALLVPAWVAIARARRLIAAGQRREELVAALAAAQARRREELAIAYGAEPSPFDRGVHWLARAALLVAAAAVWVLSTGALPPPQVGDLIPRVAAGAAAVALLAAIAARARTEQRTEPRGERRLRFWRGPLGRLVFRLAAIGVRRTSRIVTILGRLETPA